MVEIYRPAARSDHFLDASSEIATRIVDYAVTDDVKPDGQIDSKFGSVALVDFAVAPKAQFLAMSAVASVSRGRSQNPPCKSPAGIAAPATR